MAAPASPQSSFATISFNWTDKLRLIQFPSSITKSIADQIRASWPPGIQAEQVYAQHAYEYKLKGTPFGGLGAKEAVGSRRLVRDVLAFLYRRGWVLVTPISHSRHARSKDSLVFRQRRAVSVTKGTRDSGEEESAGGDVEIPPPVEWLVIAPTGGDRLRVISDGPIWRDLVTDVGPDSRLIPASSAPAPSSREHNHDELGVLIQNLKQALTAIDYFQSGEWNHDSFEFKLKGYPWSAMGEKTVKVERLLLAVVETLDRFGWRSYATVRQRSDSDDVRKADTWYFVREEGWVDGSPFNGESSALVLGA
ncbi:hypothetical protein BR93DRAFT_415988 [Coniochaeta sp. PMI_546]|nr:hypothetical protein BR93DRAFT_415988 [Coniochaeta sp. PMI_546]